MANSGKNEKPKEIGPHQWNFIKFLEFLRREDAIVTIPLSSEDPDSETDSITYSAESDNSDFRDLVSIACDLTETQTAEYFRENYKLKNKRNRLLKVRSPETSEISAVKFYFPSERFEKRKLNYPLTMPDIFFESEMKPLFTRISEKYPDLPKSIHEKVKQTLLKRVITKESPNDREHIPLIDFGIGFGPFHKLMGKVNKFYQKEADQKEIDELNSNLTILKNEYKKKFDETSSSNPNYPSLLPDYFTFHELFKEPIMTDKQSKKNAIPDLFDEKNLLSGKRFQIVKKHSQILLDIDIKRWPAWTTEQIILGTVEFTQILFELIDIALDEIQKLRFIIFFKNEGISGSLPDSEIDNLTIDELAKILLHYQLNEELNDLIVIKRNTLIKGPLRKFPVIQTAENYYSKIVIKGTIVEKLFEHFFNRLSFHTGFKFNEMSDVKNAIGRIEYKIRD